MKALRASFALIGLSLLPLSHLAAQAPAPATAPPPQSSQTAEALFVRGLDAMQSNNLDAAFDFANQSLKAKPDYSGALNLRGSIYSQRKNYDLALADFTQAHNLDPGNDTIMYNLVELKFIQKDFLGARPGFLSLEQNKEFTDLCSYKVYLCDLMSGHQQDADNELAAFNEVGSNPSYYFANAANALFNKKIEVARGWLTSAANIYNPRKFIIYEASLKELGYLPLPPPPAPPQ